MRANAIKLDGKFVGLIVFWEFDDFVYIEHLATSEHMRNSGIGANVLKLMKSKFIKPIVLEIEMPESSSTAARRMKFYQRNGFNPLLDFQYIQPPYSPGLPSIPMTLMTTGPIDPSKVAAKLHHSVYGVDEKTGIA